MANKNKKYNEIIIEGEIAKIKIESKKYGLFYALIDSEDINKIKKHTWYVKSTGNHFYVATNIYENNKQNTLRIHKLIMNPPNDMVIDHINHNPLDNRKINLRICSHKQNMENLKGCKSDNKSSGIRGVSWHKGKRKWEARIGHNKKLIFLGNFLDIKEAEQSVINARKQYFTHSQENL